MNQTELYLIAMCTIFTVPYLVWRVLRLDWWAPLAAGPRLAGRRLA